MVRSRRTAANGLNVRAAGRGVQGQLHQRGLSKRSTPNKVRTTMRRLSLCPGVVVRGSAVRAPGLGGQRGPHLMLDHRVPGTRPPGRQCRHPPGPLTRHDHHDRHNQHRRAGPGVVGADPADLRRGLGAVHRPVPPTPPRSRPTRGWSSTSCTHCRRHPARSAGSRRRARRRSPRRCRGCSPSAVRVRGRAARVPTRQPVPPRRDRRAGRSTSPLVHPSGRSPSTGPPGTRRRQRRRGCRRRRRPPGRRPPPCSGTPRGSPRSRPRRPRRPSASL